MWENFTNQLLRSVCTCCNCANWIISWSGFVINITCCILWHAQIGLPTLQCVLHHCCILLYLKFIAVEITNSVDPFVFCERMQEFSSCTVIKSDVNIWSTCQCHFAVIKYCLYGILALIRHKATSIFCSIFQCSTLHKTSFHMLLNYYWNMRKAKRSDERQVTFDLIYTIHREAYYMYWMGKRKRHGRGNY